MEITWYGHSCFRLRSRSATVVTDPYGKGTGYTLPRVRADVVTISHEDPYHNHSKGIAGKPYVVRSPGEYEVKGAFIVGIRTFCDTKNGAERGFNTIYLVEMEGLCVCHLGDLAHLPSQSQVEALSDVNVLLVPVGGKPCVSASQATEVISLIEPEIVIPMRYRTPTTTIQLDPVTKFIKAMAVKAPEPLESLKVRAKKTPSETQIVLLEPKQ
jgi:L-ascorbate metabolism protein UlaG (beta-lactamase superfamily)